LNLNNPRIYPGEQNKNKRKKAHQVMFIKVLNQPCAAIENYIEKQIIKILFHAKN